MKLVSLKHSKYKLLVKKLEWQKVLCEVKLVFKMWLSLILIFFVIFQSIAFAIVFVAALAYAAPQKPSDAVIVKQESNNIGVGPWSWGFETSDGTAAQEAGTIENEGTDDEAISVRGSFQYVNPDGELIRVNWIADRNGFQPDNLPKGP